MDSKLEEDFEEHVEKAKNLLTNIDKKDKNELYGLYMQAVYGPVMTVRPGLYNMKDPEEWDAWNAVKGESTEDAMKDYINKVDQLLGTSV